MGLDGVNITKGVIGPNTLNDQDQISGLIANGVSIVDKLELGKVYTIYNVKQAEDDLGIDAAYDDTNSVRVHRHILEFFRMAGEGVKLYLMVVDQAEDMTAMVEDSGEIYAKKLIREADGEIRQLAVALNPSSGYTPTYTDGIDGDVRTAIGKAQELAEWAYNSFRPLNVILEGRDIDGTAANMLDLKAITDTPAPKVSVIIGQDYSYADALDDIGKKYADVGTALGTVAGAPVNENIAEVGTRNLTDAGVDAWMIAGLSNHKTIQESEADLETLDDKHYIFGIRYIGVTGVRWNNDHTCVEPKVDAEGNINEHTIAYGRTIDKAARVLRAQLLPKVKTVQPIDPDTGKLPKGIVKYFEGIGNSAFDRMLSKGEISSGLTTVDPESDLLAGDKLLNVNFEVVPYGSVNGIKGKINLKRSL